MPIFSKPQYDPHTTYYTSPQKSEKLSEDGKYYLRNQLDNFVYAKQLTEQSTLLELASGKLPQKIKHEYYVRLSDDLKSVYDPRTTYAFKDKGPDFVTKVCKSSSSFTKVNYSVFQKYLSFLQSESESQYRECNRLVFGL